MRALATRVSRARPKRADAASSKQAASSYSDDS
jgi:hypothetical protein